MSQSVPKPIPAPKLPIAGQAFALITAAGASTRYGEAKKEFEPLGDLTVLERAIEPFIACCAGIVVTCPVGAKPAFEAFFAQSELRPALLRLAVGFEIVEGGMVRQESVRLGLRALATLGCTEGVVLIHDGARPWISRVLIQKTLECAKAGGACLPLIPLTETPKIVEGEYIHTHLARAHTMTAQTPQAFSFPEILAAHELAHQEQYKATDDAMIWDHYVGPVRWIEGERQNRKITYKEDIMNGPALRTGIGYDIHPLVEGRPLLLAGVRVESDRGEAGYSDGDVLWHAIIDAALGAAALGDIGSHFPPEAPEWKNADSTELARSVFGMIRERGFAIVNLDCNVICERPKLGPYRERIRIAIAETFELPTEAVSFKAKTKEGLDATGHGEAIEAQAVVLLERR